MIKKGLLTLAVVLLFSAATMADEATDAAFPVIETFQELVDVNCPYLDECNAGLAVPDNQLLGVEFDGTDYWVTNGGATSHGGTNWLERIDRNCQFIEGCAQNTTSGWGIRDLAYDVGRDILYGSDDNGLYSFNNACPVVLTNLVAPAGYPLPMRGLAHDPVTDHLWSANFSNDVIEWDYTTGQIFCRAANSWSTYGMAWDDACYTHLGYDHPMLWVHSQNGTPALRMELFDPVACAYTGDFCMGIDPVGPDDDMAGGLAFDAGNYVAGVGALIAMNQGTPDDIIMAYEICTPGGTLTMSCTNLTPVFCQGKNVYFQVTTNNTLGAPFDVTMTFQGYRGNGCVTPFGPSKSRVVNVPDNVNTVNYFFRVPNVAGPGPYSASISFTHAGNDYSCCMDFTCVACQPWKIGDNTEWVWEQVDRPEIGLPTTTALAQNYPNPFNAETNIGYVLAEAGNVNLSVYDISGRLVETLLDGYQEAGERIVTWNASDFSSGVYFYKVTTSDYTATKMMNLLR